MELKKRKGNISSCIQIYKVFLSINILGDPGADSGGEGKSTWAEK